MTASSIGGAAHRLRIESFDQGEATRLRLCGEADIASIDELRSGLRRLPCDDGVAIRLDLSELRFADIATVSELGIFASTARRRGHQVSTCGASALVERVAALLGCSSALDLQDAPGASARRSVQQRF